MAADGELQLGTWVRSGEFTGLVARVNGDDVVVFNPGSRQQMTTTTDTLQVVPASALTVTVSVDLPVPHGITEPELRRWVSSLVDDTVRARAHDALTEQDLDPGAAMPGTSVSASPSDADGALCLCGTRVPTDPGQPATCSSCGRLAVPPPQT